MTCPICSDSPSAPDYRPFCSRRCADIDLGRWMLGCYAIAAEDGPEDTLDEPPPDPEPTGSQ